MSTQREERGASKNLMLGLICLAGGAALLYLNRGFWGWSLLSLGAYGLATGVLQARVGPVKASSIAVAPATLVVVAALYLHFVARTRTRWTSALVWTVIAYLATVIIHSLLSLTKSDQVRVVLRSVLITLFGAGLLAVFHFYAQSLFPLDAILVFLGAGSMRQGLHELLTRHTEEPVRGTALLLLSDILVIMLLLGALVHYRDLVFFHMLVITGVLALFRFSIEHFIPEVSVRERRKIDSEYPQSHKAPLSFFTSLTSLHASINLLMLPLLLGFLCLSLDDYVVGFDIQHTVFQASIAVLGIVAGFTALILGERLGANEKARAHQAYVLRGLLGITFLFAVIAMVAFVGATLKPAIAQASLPPVDQVVTQLSSNSAVRLQVILAATNEFTFFAIPAALLYLYSLSADIIERFRRIKE